MSLFCLTDVLVYFDYYTFKILNFSAFREAGDIVSNSFFFRFINALHS